MRRGFLGLGDVADHCRGSDTRACSNDRQAEFMRQLARRHRQRLHIAAMTVDDQQPGEASARRERTIPVSTPRNSLKFRLIVPPNGR